MYQKYDLRLLIHSLKSSRLEDITRTEILESVLNTYTSRETAEKMYGTAS